jgi:hypothetical protein
VPSAVSNAAGFTPEILCGTLVKALRLISPEEEALFELSETLPGNVAARHRVATALARCIKAAGLPGEVGYNQLLYPNEKDVRKLLSWAVGRLPRVDAGAGEGGGGRAATPAGALLRGLGAWLKPSSAGGGGIPQRPPPGGAPMASQAALDALQRHCGCVQEGSSARESLARARALREAALSALRLAALEAGEVGEEGSAGGSGSGGSGGGGGSGSGCSGPHPSPPGASIHLALADPTSLSGLPAFSPPAWEDLLARAGPAPRHFPGTLLDASPTPFNRRAAFAIKVERRAGGAPLPASTVDLSAATRLKTEEEIAREREEELAALAARLERAKQDAEALAAQHGALAALVPSLKAALEAAAEALGALERGYMLRKACLEMLPSADSHLTRLASELAAAKGALEGLAGEWEAHRAPLAARVSAEEAAGAAAAARLEVLLGELARMRGDMGEMRSACALKEEARAKAEAELSARVAAGTESRGAYQRHIMGVVGGIRKQKAEISRIVGDVRSLQLELAAVGEGLKRIAAVALETMDRAAQENIKDGNFREAFKQLLRLQDTFGELVACAVADGAAVNETRDLENRIGQLEARNEAKALEAALSDLAAIKAENAQLAGGK